MTKLERTYIGMLLETWQADHARYTAELEKSASSGYWSACKAVAENVIRDLQSLSTIQQRQNQLRRKDPK